MCWGSGLYRLGQIKLSHINVENGRKGVLDSDKSLAFFESLSPWKLPLLKLSG